MPDSLLGDSPAEFGCRESAECQLAKVLELDQQHRPQTIHDTALRYLADEPGEEPLPPEVTVDERDVEEVVAELREQTKPWHIAVLSLRGRGERRGAVRDRPVRGAVGGSSIRSTARNLKSCGHVLKSLARLGERVESGSVFTVVTIRHASDTRVVHPSPGLGGVCCPGRGRARKLAAVSRKPKVTLA